jgi:hypothetical protein
MELLVDAHSRVEAGIPAPGWPDLVPELYRPRLESNQALGTKLAEYENLLPTLNATERQRLRSALDEQNAIPSLLSNATVCRRAEQLPTSAVSALRKLVDFAFGLLTRLPTSDVDASSDKLSIRDRQYEILFSELPARCCPFCGCERFDPPKRSIVSDPAKREDLDHYLPRTAYPFAAVNLRNLVPMGKKCNQSYKGTADPIRAAGQSRSAFDPYGVIPKLTISLDQSVLLGETGQPEWAIELGPQSPQLDTWNAVFDIRRRWIETVLEVEYPGWLSVFAQVYRDAYPDSVETEQLLEVLHRTQKEACYAEYAELAFLKAKVFGLIRERCTGGDDALLSFLRDLIADNTDP